MRELEYDVEEVGVRPPTSFHVVGLPGPLAALLPGPLFGLFVKECDLPGITDQNSMSQGMFRALSILIQVNYSQMAKKATCILIDDIGEGLDFERSWRLIDLFRRKAEDTSIQLVLSTNDRFVMNHVPLDEWSVLQRQGGHVQVRNCENSRDVFEEFRFTGLSNFSFLEMDFASGSRLEECRRMNRLAVFVEGYTEVVFVQKLIEEIAGKNNVLIEHRAIRGGSAARRTAAYHGSPA